jgi:hypothetical protein
MQHHRRVAPYRPEAAMNQHGRRSPATSSSGSRHTLYQSLPRYAGSNCPYHTRVALISRIGAGGDPRSGRDNACGAVEQKNETLDQGLKRERRAAM